MTDSKTRKTLRDKADDAEKERMATVSTLAHFARQYGMNDIAQRMEQNEDVFFQEVAREIRTLDDQEQQSMNRLIQQFKKAREDELELQVKADIAERFTENLKSFQRRNDVDIDFE